MPFRPRALLAIASVCALGVLGLAVQPDRHAPRASVATEGPADQQRSSEPAEDVGDPEDATEAAGRADQVTSTDEKVITDAPRTTSPTAVGPTFPSTTATTSTSVPPSPSHVDGAEEPEDLGGSPDVRGRVLFTTVSGALKSMRPDGTDVRPEVTCPRGGMSTGAYDVSPDGRWIVQVCTEFNPATGMGGAFGLFNLLLMRTDGSQLRALVADAWDDVASSWSPDGRTIAVSDRHGLTLYDAAGGPSRAIEIEYPADDPNSSRGQSRVSWAPDGNRLLLDNLFVYDLAADELTRFWPEDSGSNDYGDAVWSPDGEWIYVLAYRSSWYSEPPHQFQRIDPATLAVDVLLTDLEWGPSGLMLQGRSYINGPVFTDDGTLLLRWNGSIWSMNPDGSDQTVVVADAEVYRLSTPLTH